jgi:hypothetical protein
MMPFGALLPKLLLLKGFRQSLKINADRTTKFESCQVQQDPNELQDDLTRQRHRPRVKDLLVRER